MLEAKFLSAGWLMTDKLYNKCIQESFKKEKKKKSRLFFVGIRRSSCHTTSEEPLMDFFF